jgi:hypothetical protein
MSGYRKNSDGWPQGFALKCEDQTPFSTQFADKRYFLAEEDKWITLKVSTEAIRTINKKGLYNVVKEMRANGQHI